MAKAHGDVRRLFGERVRELRSERGFTQEAFAAHVHIDRGYIGAVERGERNVSLLTVEKIANALDIEIRDLF